MGWCQAFGPQIQEGCDHSMVAGSNSCSCPECGVVCLGRFPGCRTVWDAGPQRIEVRRPRTERGSQLAPEPAATTNGHRSYEGSAAPKALPVSTSGPLPESGSVFARQSVSPSGASVDDYADLRSLVLGLQSAIDALPRRIAKAASDAMRQQHASNKQELADLWQAIHAEVQQLADARPEAPPADPQVIIEEFDARFQWLVTELSTRFMVLGNELVRIEKRVGDLDRGDRGDHGDHGVPAANGHGGHTAASTDFQTS